MATARIYHVFSPEGLSSLDSAQSTFKLRGQAPNEFKTRQLSKYWLGNYCVLGSTLGPVRHTTNVRDLALLWTCLQCLTVR